MPLSNIFSFEYNTEAENYINFHHILPKMCLPSKKSHLPARLLPILSISYNKLSRKCTFPLKFKSHPTDICRRQNWPLIWSDSLKCRIFHRTQFWGLITLKMHLNILKSPKWRYLALKRFFLAKNGFLAVEKNYWRWKKLDSARPYTYVKFFVELDYERND